MSKLATLKENLLSVNGEFKSIAYEITELDEGKVLEIRVVDKEDFPAYLSISDDELLCVSYLFDQCDVVENRKSEMHERMLEFNISMPLSSFAKIGDRYLVYGSLSVNSKIELIVTELDYLVGNALEALKYFDNEKFLLT